MKISKKINESGWKSISMVSNLIEYHNGMKMIRFHPSDPFGAHIYDYCFYPTGLLPEGFNGKKHKQKKKIKMKRESKLNSL